MIDFFAFLYDKITNELVLTIAIPIGLILALIFSWDMGLQKTTFLAGKKLAPEIGDTGLQDAITPPWKTKLSMFLYAITLVFFVTCFFRFGWPTGVAIIVLFWFTSAVSYGIFMPRAESPHYIKLVAQSLANRLADYTRDGDLLRADASQELLDKLVTLYQEQLDPNTQD